MEKEEKVSVLVVDDDAGMVESLCDILHEKGYEAEGATTGEEALKKANRRSFDCFLMDIKMPGKNGVDTFRELKEINPVAYVVFMTAYSASELVDEAKEEGAIEVLAKPLDLDKVADFVERSHEDLPILIVDDDKEFCETLEDVLTEKSFEVNWACDPDDALKCYMSCPRSVILLDMKLGTFNGLDVLIAIKKVNPAAIVILMTGFRDEMEDKMKKGLRMSAYACIYKPFEMDDLLGIIENLRAQRTKGE